MMAALVVCIVIPAMAYAECLLGDGGGEKVTAVYYTNGMMASLSEAHNISLRLEREYGSLAQSHTGSQYEFGTSYNPSTHNLAADVRNVLLQKADQEGLIFSANNIRRWARGLARQIAAGETLGRMLVLARKYVPNWELTQDDLAEVADGAVEGLATVLLRGVDPGTVATHVACYLENLAEGKRVVVVAHSQGNLYANDAIDAVARAAESSASIAVVGVATPASRIVGARSGYVTAKDDIVIDILRAGPGMVLKAKR